LYEGTVVSDDLQREVVRDLLKRAGLAGPDQNLPAAVKVRHGRNAQGKLLHYYLNFSSEAQSVSYAYGSGTDLLTDGVVQKGHALALKAWDLAIVVEQ
jgi:beta-galactosidase